MERSISSSSSSRWVTVGVYRPYSQCSFHLPMRYATTDGMHVMDSRTLPHNCVDNDPASGAPTSGVCSTHRNSMHACLEGKTHHTMRWPGIVRQHTPTHPMSKIEEEVGLPCLRYLNTAHTYIRCSHTVRTA